VNFKKVDLRKKAPSRTASVEATGRMPNNRGFGFTLREREIRRNQGTAGGKGIVDNEKNPKHGKNYA